MSSNRAFRNLAALRDSFVEAQPEEDDVAASAETTVRGTVASSRSTSDNIDISGHSTKTLSIVSNVSEKVDGRRQRKVLKTPSVQLSVSVRREIHEDVSAMLFAQKSTWIALLDELLSNYVQQEKNSGRFPK